MPPTPSQWPLVGRDDVLQEAHEVIESGAGVLFAGPLGSGKTCLAREVASRLDHAGERVVRVVASIGQPLPPLNVVDYLLVDDIQHLDPDNALLLHRWVDDGDGGLIATFRTGDGHRMPPMAESLWRANHLIRIECPPLERADVDELLDLVLDGPIDAATRRRIWDLTLGAPLYLRELVTAALRGGSLTDASGIWRIDADLVSPALDDLIADRVRALTPNVRRAIELVALGEPIGIRGLPVEADALAAGEEAGLIASTVDDRRRELRMVHPLVGDVVRRLIPAPRAAELCGNLLRVAEQQPMRRRSDIVRTAILQVRAGGAVVSDDMILAARRALYDRHDRVALQLARRATDDQPVAATIVLGEALTNEGRYRHAEELLRELDGTHSDMETALIAIQRAEALFWGLGAADAAMSTLAEAERKLRPGDWRAELAAERAVLTAMQGRLRDAAAICRSLADETSDRVVVTAAIASSVTMSLGTHPEDAIELSQEALKLSGQLSDQPFLTSPAMHVVAEALALGESGRLAEALAVASAGYEFAVAEGARDGQAWLALALGRARLMTGAFDAARRSFAEAAAAFGQLDSPGPRRWALAGLVLVEAGVGAATSVEMHWESLVALTEHPARMMDPEVGRAAAWRMRLAGDRRAAADLLHETANAANSVGQEALAIGALHDIVRLGVVDGRYTAASWDAIAEPQGLLAPARRSLGLAVIAGDGGVATQAAEAFASAGSGLFAAEADFVAGRLFRAAGRARESAAALRRAADRQQDLGIEWLLSLDGPVDQVALTERERQVSDLAATGRSNREIADDLGISVRTAENHLQRVFTKLGVNSRTELDNVIG